MDARDKERNWQVDALCADVNIDPDSFFPDGHSSAHWKDSVLICQDCPVQRECLSYALEAHESYGMWGGKTPPERLDIIQEAMSSMS